MCSNWIWLYFLKAKLICDTFSVFVHRLPGEKGFSGLDGRQASDGEKGFKGLKGESAGPREYCKGEKGAPGTVELISRNITQIVKGVSGLKGELGDQGPVRFAIF